MLIHLQIKFKFTYSMASLIASLSLDIATLGFVRKSGALAGGRSAQAKDVPCRAE